MIIAFGDHDVVVQNLAIYAVVMHQQRLMVIFHEVAGDLAMKIEVAGQAIHSSSAPSSEFQVLSPQVVVDDVTGVCEEAGLLL